MNGVFTKGFFTYMEWSRGGSRWEKPVNPTSKVIKDETEHLFGTTRVAFIVISNRFSDRLEAADSTVLGSPTNR